MSEERKMILTMLQEGKISVDEAERLLKALHESNGHDGADEAKTTEQSLSDIVDWKAWDDRKREYRQKTGGFKFYHYFDSFIRKLKDVDLDFNFGSYETVNHIFVKHTNAFSDIAVEIKNGAVTVIPWDEEVVRIDCEAKVYKVKSGEEARERFLEEARFNVEDGTFLFVCEVQDIKCSATIHVPKKTYHSVAMRMFNGDIRGENILASELRAKTVNGSITCSHLQAVLVELETGNGTITVDGSADKIVLETLNGAIRASGAFHECDAESFSGAIQAEFKEAGRASLKATTGGIDVAVPRDVTVNGDLQTVFGSIHCQIDSFDILQEKKELANRSLQFVANSEAESSFLLDVKTRMGSITIKES